MCGPKRIYYIILTIQRFRFQFWGDFYSKQNPLFPKSSFIKASVASKLSFQIVCSFSNLYNAKQINRISQIKIWSYRKKKKKKRKTTTTNAESIMTQIPQASFRYHSITHCGAGTIHFISVTSSRSQSHYYLFSFYRCI